MSQDITKELPDSRSFEERVFARFDAMNSRFDAIDARLTKIELRLDNVEARLDKVEARLDKLETSVNDMDARLGVLESKAYDTKPIWERALTEILALSQKVDGIDRKLNVMNRDMLTLRADQERLEERMDQL